jgi:putative redox protein
MELLLVGLAGCAAMDVLAILRKKRQDVTDYEVRVHGVRAEEHPMVFTTIDVEHIVTGHDIEPAAVARAIELSETRYCGAGAMLGRTAAMRHTYRIQAVAARADDALADDALADEVLVFSFHGAPDGVRE